MNRRAALGLISAADLALAWQHTHQDSPRKLEFLSEPDAAEIEAIAAQIIPSDETPGAKEAGAIYFIDKALAGWDRGKRDLYRRGMDNLQTLRRQRFPSTSKLAELTAAQLIELITAIEKTEFFEVIRTHTVLGFLGPQSYGGNRGMVGWTHIGVEDKMIFEPPFGYYDAEALKEEKR